MFLSIDLFNLILYAIQQLGVMLGVGAETILLLAYIISMRDGSVSDDEEHFSKAVRKVLIIGVLCIVVSGALITGVHVFSEQWSVILSPAFLFKWMLIAIVLLFAFGIRGFSLPMGLAEGFAGASWYALFAVHILAPVASWAVLLMLYAVGIIGFMLFWTSLVMSTRNKRPSGRGAAAQKKVPGQKGFSIPGFSKGKNVAAASAVRQSGVVITPSNFVPQKNAAGVTAVPVQQGPVPLTPVPGQQPQQTKGPFSGLPAINVMPRTPEDLQNRGRTSFA